MLTFTANAERHHTGCGRVPIVCEPSNVVVVPTLRPASPESKANERLVAHAAILRQIAIYDFVVNRDGAEIAAAQLRVLGVSEEDIREARSWTKVHCSSPATPAHR